MRLTVNSHLGQKNHNHSRSLGDEVNHGNPIQFFPQSWDTRKIWFSYTMKMDEHGPGHIKIQPISSNDFGWAIMHWSFHRQFRMVDQWHISDVTLLQVWTLHAIMSLIYCIVICFVSLFSCDKTHTNKQEKTTFKTPAFHDETFRRLNRFCHCMVCWGEADTTETESAKRSRRRFQRTLWLGWLCSCWMLLRFSSTWGYKLRPSCKWDTLW